MNFSPRGRFSIFDFRFRPQSKTCPERSRRIQNLKSKILSYGRLIRFSHTVFALPFALSSVALAWPAHPPTAGTLLWILIAMVGARSAAMGFNRLADRNFDALNPRTSAWELPQGTVKVPEAVLLTLVSSLIFIYAAYRLNFLCFALSPLALAIVFFYSLTKRFTWTSHLFLGLALSLAPVGAWLAVAGSPLDTAELKTPLFLGLAVLFWLAGFDVIYSLQDRTFDLEQGLYSIPARFGIAAALRLSSFFHLCTAIFLALVGLAAQLGIIYWLGFTGLAAILFWEHRVVTPTDLSRINRAFFDFNAYISVGYFLITVGDLLLNARLGS
jgi:4-hydroxybenzoate polyprenyltransferase